MADLAARLRYLRNAEAAIALVLPAAIVMHWTSDGAPVAWPLRALALALVSALLIQGALYWHLKLRSVQTGSGLPPWFAPLYRGLRRANVAAFALYGGVFAFAATRGLPPADLAWSGALFVFAVLEHVNYYHRQLMYDNAHDVRALLKRRRLRRAALGTDLARAAAAP
jgi:hypothetical protein